jgi:hypothetical protein
MVLADGPALPVVTHCEAPHRSPGQHVATGTEPEVHDTTAGVRPVESSLR